MALTFMKRICHGLVVALTASSVVLSGCSQAQIAAAAVKNDAADSCAPRRAPLQQVIKDYEARLTRNVVGGAAAGAAVGAVAGQGDIGAILVGAAIGSLVAAAATYYDNREREFSDRAALRTAIAQDVQGARQNVQTLSTAITELNQCRNAQIAQLRRDVRNRAITVDNGKLRAAQLREWMDGDRTIVQGVLGEVTEGNQVYADAYARSRDLELGRVTPRAASYEPKPARARANEIPTRLTSRPRGANDMDNLAIDTQGMVTLVNAQDSANTESLDNVQLLLAQPA